MGTEAAAEAKAKRQLTIRGIPASDYAALERMGRRLGMATEKFGRTVLRLVARGEGPRLFERALREALGSPAPDDEGLDEDDD